MVNGLSQGGKRLRAAPKLGTSAGRRTKPHGGGGSRAEEVRPQKLAQQQQLAAESPVATVRRVKFRNCPQATFRRRRRRSRLPALAPLSAVSRCPSVCLSSRSTPTPQETPPEPAPGSMAGLAAETVAERLRDRATRSATLAALESHAAPIPTAVSLAAAPALVGLMTMDAAEVEREAYDCAGLLLGQLHAEALPDVLAVHGVAFGEGGYERLWNADSVLNTALRQPAAELTRADAMSFACYLAHDTINAARGCTEPYRAAGLTVLEFLGLWMSAEPIASKKKLPKDDVPTKMVTLLLELLRSNELPELAIGGAVTGVFYCLTGRPSIGPVALKHGVVELVVEHLKAIGSPADWVSISRGKAGRAYKAVCSIAEMCKHFSGEVSRPDLAACVASELFDLCLEAITAVAAAGVDGLQDTHHGALYYALSVVRICRAQPGCEDKIRSAAAALAFCLMNDLDFVVDIGVTTGAVAAQICENPRAALSRGEATTNTKYTLHLHTHILDTAGLVVQAAVCSVATKVALISASRRNTSKPCEWTHRVQCGSAAENRLLTYGRHARLLQR
eukprot:COSAG06_NODE_493_length_15060_cov_50.594546_14_plen_563_part_00